MYEPKWMSLEFCIAYLADTAPSRTTDVAYDRMEAFIGLAIAIDEGVVRARGWVKVLESPIEQKWQADWRGLGNVTDQDCNLKAAQMEDLTPDWFSFNMRFVLADLYRGLVIHPTGERLALNVQVLQEDVERALGSGTKQEPSRKPRATVDMVRSFLVKPEIDSMRTRPEQQDAARRLWIVTDDVWREAIKGLHRSPGAKPRNSGAK